MLGPGRISRNIGQVHLGLLRTGQLDLGLLGRFLQALQCQRIVVQIDGALFLELCGEVFDQPHVKIFTAEEGVTVGGQHLKLVFAIDFGNLDDGDIESTATEVVNRDSVITLGLVHTVGQCSCRRLVDNTLHLKPGDLAGILGGLAL